MLLRAYSIFDNKALQYHPAFYATTDAVAVRMLTDMANDMQTNIGRHPSDYILYCVGTFNDANGLLMPIDPKEHIRDAISVVKPSPQLFDRIHADPTSP